MSIASLLPIKQTAMTKKQVLQQSNFNFEASPEKDDNQKGYLLKNREVDEAGQETENHFKPRTKTPDVKSLKIDEAKKLRSIRLDLSSLKRGPVVLQRGNALSHKPESEFSSDDSGEDESKKRRKTRPVVPNYVTNSDSGPCRKPRQSKQDSAVLSSQNSTMCPKTQPLSIARRNARERNRVKQVNEGFATLRNRIPDYISEAYNEEKGRKSAKKLSKVETLRMAVDYIRHLETLLDLRSTDEDNWLKEVKTESQHPWETPNSFGDYPSPPDSKFQTSPPAGYYDQNFEYQDRIFYEYDLDFLEKKDNFQTNVGPGAEGNRGTNQCVDDFKFYESFNRLKRDENGTESGADENFDEGSRDSENPDFSEAEPEETRLSPKPIDVINKISKKTVLPSITESFNKGIPVFF